MLLRYTPTHAGTFGVAWRKHGSLHLAALAATGLQ
jgi:hypothetical protein